MWKYSGFIGIVCASLILAGCGENTESRTGESGTKFYFTANIYGGETFRTNRGSGVYENGSVKKLHRYHVLTRVTQDGSKLIAFTPDHGEYIEILNLGNNKITAKFKRGAYPIIFRWFSDNKRVVFAGGDEGPGPYRPNNIYVMDIETMEVEKITDYDDERDSMYYIDLSPDEKKVVYSMAKRGGKHTTVKIVDIETREEKVLPFSSLAFAWNPSTNNIVLFGIDKDHNGEIEYGSRLIIYDPEKDEIVKKYPKDDSYSHMAWMTNSPDGERIAYVRNENSGALTVWTMNPDGTDQKMVWNPGFFIRDLNWTE